MTRRSRFLIALTVLLSGVDGVSPAADDFPVRPNVVVILADDLGYADLRSYGSSFHETPNLDRLAARGIRFTQGYAACPVCSPTRAALLTGRSPARLNLTDWLPGRPDRPDQPLARPVVRQELPLEEITIAELLRSAGYVTANIGKWHLGEGAFLPTAQGFDVNVGGSRIGSPPGGYFKFRMETLEARDENEYLTDRLTEEAVAFIEANRDRPFFLYLPHYAVHTPLQARADLTAKYQRKLDRGEKGVQTNPIYAAMIESLDEGVGRVVATLERLGLAEKTLLVFTSDNGGLSVREGPATPATSNAPLRAGKGHLYEGGIRVPWIVAWPGRIEAGRVCDAPVITLDLFPTLAEIVGAPLPADRPLDGVSFLPLLDGADTIERGDLQWHYPHYSNQGGKPDAAIRRGNDKLIEFYEDGRVELYDLAQDPSETRDLAGSRPDRAAELLGALRRWRDDVDARMMTPNPDYRGSR